MRKSRIASLLALVISMQCSAQQSWILPVTSQPGSAGGVYFINAQNNQVQGAPIATNGSWGMAMDKRGYIYVGNGPFDLSVISPITRSIVTTLTSSVNYPVGMVVSPDNNYLFVSNYFASSNQVSVYDISVPGALTYVSSINLPAVGAGVGWLEMNAAGTELFVAADYGSSALFKVTNLFTTPIVQTFNVGTYNATPAHRLDETHCVAIDKARGLVYVTDQLNKVVQTWNTAGVQMNVTYEVPASAGLHGLTLSANGDTLYVSSIKDRQTYRFQTVTTGLPQTAGSASIAALATTPTQPGAGATGAGMIPLLPDGTKLYAFGMGKLYEYNTTTLALNATISADNVSSNFVDIDMHGAGVLLNDFGDAPASYGNAAHALNNSNYFNGLLKIGSLIDGDSTPVSNSTNAVFDDNSNPLAGVVDDEDAFAGMYAPPINSTTYSVTIPVLNNTGGNARLVVWVDFNRDGDFDDAGETSALQTIASSASSQNIVLNFSGYTKASASATPTYMRIRLTTDTQLTATAANARDVAFLDGEVEDFPLIVNATLPLNFTSFTATAVGVNTNLAWETANEVNNDHFVVEYSTDGINFTSAGTVTAGSAYRFVHTQAASRTVSGILHYRLKQVDIDGRFTYSRIESVTFGKPKAVTVFPNPVKANGLITITAPSISTVDVFSSTGQLVWSNRYNNSNVINIPASQFGKGVYMLRVNGTTTNKLVIAD